MTAHHRATPAPFFAFCFGFSSTYRRFQRSALSNAAALAIRLFYYNIKTCCRQYFDKNLSKSMPAFSSRNPKRFAPHPFFSDLKTLFFSHLFLISKLPDTPCVLLKSHAERQILPLRIRMKKPGICRVFEKSAPPDHGRENYTAENSALTVTACIRRSGATGRPPNAEPC